jgi:membrane AbrB-like protein
MMLARSSAGRWFFLLALSAAFVIAFEFAGLAGAGLLGPMAAGIVLAARSRGLGVPVALFAAAQGLVGLLIAHNVPVWILVEMTRSWPVVATSVVAVIGASSLIGYVLARGQALPGTTAIWGLFPGGASVMMLMASESGGDGRLVGFMQYLRVVLVTLVASLVARFWLPHGSASVTHAAWFPGGMALPLFETMALAFSGSWLGRRLKVPAGALLVPMVIGIALQDTGVLTIELPRWLLAGAYAVVGWSVGLRFTTAVLAHAWSVLPRVLVAMTALIAICGGFAAALTWIMHIDPLTAYLATSPGGIDSVAIIAASSPVDVPFVMAMQTARMLAVLVAGPAIARALTRRVSAGMRARGVDLAGPSEPTG